MIAIACVLLIIFVLFIMAHQGVGPFTREPWYQVHLKLLKKSHFIQRSLLLVASVGSVICAAAIIGLFE